jgi:hypothetical protein
VDDRNWEATYESKGRIIGRERFSISPDGKTLTDTSTFVQSGKEVKASAVMNRVGSGSGLMGTWKSEQIKMDPFDLEIVPNGSDGLLFRIVDIFEAKGRFDGKPNPVSGPQAAKSTTLAFTRIDQRTFKMEERIEGKPTFEATVSVSDDRQTLTETGTGGNVKRVWVFERQ